MVLFAVAVAVAFAAVVVGDVDVALDEDATIVIIVIILSTIYTTITGANYTNTKHASKQATMSSIKFR